MRLPHTPSTVLPDKFQNFKIFEGEKAIRMTLINTIEHLRLEVRVRVVCDDVDGLFDAGGRCCQRCSLRTKPTYRCSCGQKVVRKWSKVITSCHELSRALHTARGHF